MSEGPASPPPPPPLSPRTHDTINAMMVRSGAVMHGAMLRRYYESSKGVRTEKREVKWAAPYMFYDPNQAGHGGRAACMSSYPPHHTSSLHTWLLLCAACKCMLAHAVPRRAVERMPSHPTPAALPCTSAMSVNESIHWKCHSLRRAAGTRGVAHVAATPAH